MHDTNRHHQIEKILQITNRLFQMQSISIRSEAERFDINERTIRRDLHKINQIIPLKKTPDGWRINLSAKSFELLDQALLQAFAESARIRAACLDRHTHDVKAVELAIRYHRLPKELGKTMSGKSLKKELRNYLNDM